LEPWLYIEEPSIPWSSPTQVEQGGASLQLVLPLDREVLSMGVSTARRRPTKNGSRQTWVPSRKHKERRQFLFVYGPGGGELIEP
jgi:hypothetical protein